LKLPKRLTSPDPDLYLTGSYIVLDFETSAIEYGSSLNLQNELLLACWYDSRTKTTHHTWGSEHEQQELLRAISEVDYLVAQNAKFELGWLDRCGLDLHEVVVYDTFLAEWVLLGNRKDPKDLGSLAKRRGLQGKIDSVSWMIKLGVDPRSIPKPWLQEYCHEDVRTTLEVFLKQLEELKDRDQLHLVYARCLLTPVLVDMEKNGVTLDPERVKSEYDKVLHEYRDVEEQLRQYGDLNWRSRQQVGELLYDTLGFDEVRDRRGQPLRTASGQRGTTKEVIASLKATNKLQREFLDLFKRQANLQAKLSKTLEFFKGVCEEHDCNFKGLYNQGVTSTHRLSSSGRKLSFRNGTELGIQLQNMPREYKKLVTARHEDWLIVEADQSQLEFRGAASLTGDPVALQEIIESADIHSVTAEFYIKEGSDPEFKGKTVAEARQAAKPKTFRPTFGGTGITKADKAYSKFFADKYHVMYTAQTAWTYEVLKTGKLRTPYGMEFFWPGTGMNAYGKVDNMTAIFNFPIQGISTGEIVPISLVWLWHRLRGRKVRFVLTIHDSVVLEVSPDEDLEWIKAQIVKAFTSDVFFTLENLYSFKMTVPLGCEIGIGTHWGEGDKFKYQMEI